MGDSAVVPAALDEFFRRWEASGAAERANYSTTALLIVQSIEGPDVDV